MPASKTVSTKKVFTKVTVEELQAMQIAGPPVAYDPAVAAAISRAIAKIERQLYATRLTPAQSKLVSQLRDFRGIFWRMIPEGY